MFEFSFDEYGIKNDTPATKAAPKTQSEVKRVFDELTELLGEELFRKLFEVILTDGATEFQNSILLEYNAYQYLLL